MVKILLVCDQGFSTSLMETALKKEAVKQGVEASIEAIGMAALPNHVSSADVVLLGPQVSYRMDEIAKKYPDQKNKVYLMNPSDFALLESEKIFNIALQIANSKEN